MGHNLPGDRARCGRAGVYRDARGAATIAKVIFFIFLAIFVLMLILAILGISLIA